MKMYAQLALSAAMVCWTSSAMAQGGFVSEHDQLIASKLANVLCGGQTNGRSPVSEEHVLDLEREAFMSLVGEPKTIERMQYMLMNNKPLRN